MKKTTQTAFIKKATFLFFTLLFSYSFSQTTDIITTTGNGNFTVPCDVTSIVVEAWGAGGAGGGRRTNNIKGGGGGAGGTYVSSTLTVTPGEVISYYVAPTTNGVTDHGANGQDSWFNSALILNAEGGEGGRRPNNTTVAGGNGSTASSIGDTRIIGFDAGNGTTTVGGDGGNGGNSGGTGGASRTNEGNGNNGNTPGGGGGGAFIPDNTNHRGGHGARGEIRISYTTTPTSYCAITYATAIEAITNVTFAGINKTTAAGTAGGAHEILCDNANVLQGASYPISVNGDTGGSWQHSVTVFIDWNQDNAFNNTDERYEIGTIDTNDGTGTPATNTIAVPVGATVGTTTMRVIKSYDSTPVYATDGCTPSSGYGQTEDYNVTVTAPGPCSEPTAQATGLSLSVAGTVISGAFTAASPAPDNYLVVANTTGIAPSPAPNDTTTYTIGGTVGVGNTVVDVDGDTNFTATGLDPTTTYYFFIYSFNSACTGGPDYLTNSPLTGNDTTGIISYCTPSTTNDVTFLFIDDLEFIGTLNDVSNFGNGSSAAPAGYQDFTSLTNASQQQGEGINVYVAGNLRGHIKAWIDWNIDGTFDVSEEVYDSGITGTTSTTFGYIVPLAQPVGTYRLRVRIYNSFDFWGDEDFDYDFDACEAFDSLAGYTEYGDTEDYTFDVVTRCDAQITSITNGEACGVSETVDLNVTGAGNVTSYHWYANETGGTELAETFTGDWITPAIATTTTYWVAADNGTCEAYERERVIAFLNAPATLTFTPSTPLICGENSPPIQISAASTTQIGYLIDEDFEGGIGSFTENNITVNGAPFDGISEWQPRTSTFVPSEYVWFPAVSSGFGTNSFVMTSADSGAIPTENELISAVVDASTYINLTLDLNMYFSRYNLAVPEEVKIEVSTDGGATWPNNIATITDDVGYGSNFDFLTYDLSAFIGEANLRVRIYYYSDWGDGVAVDNIQLYGNNTVNPLATWTNPPGVQIFEDAAGLIPYTGDSRNVVYVVPSPAELQTSSTWSFSASVTLANGCAATGSVNLANKTKYFMGATNDWTDPNNWSPSGVPTSANCVIIPDTYNVNIAGGMNGDAYNMNVQNGGQIDIQANGSVTVQNFVDVDATGTFNIESSGSLIQVLDQSHIDYVANTGDIDMKRNTNIRKTDYVFWSSPVANLGVTSISPGTSTNYIYKWIPTNAANTNGFGNWKRTTETMINAKGYIVRGPDSYNATLQNYTATLTGVPNNGSITHQILRGNYDGADYAGPTATIVTKNDDNLNLIGNPYPSALNAIDFMTANTDIEGAVHIWTHGTEISSAIADPFYADYVQNYTVNDYITYNSVGASSGAGTFNGYIGSGQGFFVTMLHASATPANITFDNTMRDRTYDNSDFRTSEVIQTNNEPIERHRIWLTIISPDNKTNNTLVGYVSGATQAKDRLYDANILESTDFGIFSKIDNNRLIIQGRLLPFQDTDQVSLGLLLDQTGIHSISIKEVDGLFGNNNQDIFIEDTVLGTIHNLRNAPYTFTADNIGLIEDRFVLRYTDPYSILDVEGFDIDSELTIFAVNQQITAISKSNAIKTFIIYDMLGRVIANENNLNTLEYRNSQTNHSQGTYIVQVELHNGSKVTKKLVY